MNAAKSPRFGGSAPGAADAAAALDTRLRHGRDRPSLHASAWSAASPGKPGASVSMRCGRRTSSREGTALLFRVASAPATGKSPCFTSRAHFCHSALMETHAFGFRLRANAPEGQKRFPISISDYVRAWWDRRGRSVLRLAIVVMSVLAALKLGDEFYRLLFSNMYTRRHRP